MTAAASGRSSGAASILTALLAIFLTVLGVLCSVFYFAGEATYRDLARERGAEEVTFPLTGGGTWHVGGIEGLVDIHRRTLAYLFNGAAELPLAPDGQPLFDGRERSHMADVRAVFGFARTSTWLSLVGLAAALIAVRRAQPADGLRIVRNAALAAGGVVLLVALFAAVAFGPAFLLFHQLFFPQGNFLFDPATSNLLRVYPEPYWYGVTLRVFGSFLLACGLIAGLVTWRLRQRSGR